MIPVSEAQLLIAQIAGAVAHAHQPAHWWDPFSDVPAPGNDVRHAVHIDDIRCVYSVSLLDGKPWRHLSVSRRNGELPTVPIALAIAYAFGFTGWDPNRPDLIPDAWVVAPSLAENAGVVLQPYEDDSAS